MRKVKSKKGFTLVEMLVCVLTLLLVGAICATGTGISIKSYQESRFESDSQMLQSSIDMIFSDILRYATEVNTDSGVVFTNKEYDIANGTVLIAAAGDNGENRFVIKKNPTTAESLMLGDNVYAGNLEVSDFELSYNSTTGVFSGSYKIKSTIMNDAVKNCEFTFRSISSSLLSVGTGE